MCTVHHGRLMQPIWPDLARSGPIWPDPFVARGPSCPRYHGSSRPQNICHWRLHAVGGTPGLREASDRTLARGDPVGTTRCRPRHRQCQCQTWASPRMLAGSHTHARTPRGVMSSPLEALHAVDVERCHPNPAQQCAPTQLLPGSGRSWMQNSVYALESPKMVSGRRWSGLGHPVDLSRRTILIRLKTVLIRIGTVPMRMGTVLIRIWILIRITVHIRRRNGETRIGVFTPHMECREPCKKFDPICGMPKPV